MTLSPATKAETLNDKSALASVVEALPALSLLKPAAMSSASAVAPPYRLVASSAAPLVSVNTIVN